MAGTAVTVTLGEQRKRADQHLASGRYATMSELVRAGLRALDREEAALDTLMRDRIEEALADNRADVPLEDAFAQVRGTPGHVMSSC